MVILDKYSKKTIKLVSFDIDGTITRWKNVGDFLKKSLSKLGITYKEEYLDGLYLAMQDRESHVLITGDEWDVSSYNYFLENRIPILREFRKTGEDLRTVMYEMEPEETYINDDVKKEIEQLSNLYKLVCYTSWDLAQATKKLEKYGLTRYFETIYAPEIFRYKRTKVAFQTIAYKHHIDPEKIVHIGDSSSEINAAKSAGCAAIYLDYNIKNGNDITEEKMRTIQTADAAINEFSDIRRVLTRYKNDLS